MFDFPSSPATGTLYQPAGGPTYRWSGTVWTAVAAQFQGAMPSDVAPGTPVPGQLWWESDTGALFVYFDDGNSQQWVQISGTVGLPPSDGNEYVMRNGGWRLSRQVFDLAGLTQLDIPVPSWSPVTARITTWTQTTAVAQQAFLRLSVDGTNFLAGATDYSVAGFTHSTGTNAFTNIPSANSNSVVLTSSQDNATMPLSSECLIKLIKFGSEYITYRLRGESHNSAAASQFISAYYVGYVGGASGSLKAIRWALTAGAVTGRLTVEWLP